MIQKIYQLVALSCNKGDTAEPSPRPMSNPRVVFLCYGLWQETRHKNRKIKRVSRKTTCVSTNLHLQVLKDDHLSKILCKDHLWKNLFTLHPPAFFTPFFPNEKSKHERSNQGTKVPRLSTLDIQKRSLHLKVSAGSAHFVRMFPHWGPERSQVSGDVDDNGPPAGRVSKNAGFSWCFSGGADRRSFKAQNWQGSFKPSFRKEDVSSSHSFKLPVPKGTKTRKTYINVKH